MGSASSRDSREKRCPSHARGQVLYPWPNRMGDGEWPFSGRVARPTIDDVAHATAIHGLARWRPFRAEALNQNRCVLSLLLHPTPEYPFLERDQRGLPPRVPSGSTVTTTVTNRDDVLCLSGRASTPISRWTTPTIEGSLLEVPADGPMLRLTTVSSRRGDSPLAGHQMDFSRRKSLSGHELDVTYTDLVRDDAGPGGGHAAKTPTAARSSSSVDRNFPYFQVYTGDNLEKWSTSNVRGHRADDLSA